MGVSETTETIRKKILDDSEKEAEKLKTEAQERADEILNAAKERADEMKKAEIEKIRKHVDELAMQDIAEKKVDHHRRLQTYKSELIDDTFDKAKERLRKYREKPEYEKTLHNFIVEASAALGGGKLLLQLNEKDGRMMRRQTLEKLSKEVEKTTQTQTEITLNSKSAKTIGGAIVSTADQNATIGNTFEARLERMKEKAKKELEAILFK